MLWNIRRVVKKGDYRYAVVPEHPFATDNGYVLEHRVLMENKLDRMLYEGEVVHHKNECSTDNDIDNLEVMTNEEHRRLHGIKRGVAKVRLKCPECECEFVRERRQTHLSKDSSLGATFCSPSCRGSFSRRIQIEGYIQMSHRRR